MDKKPITHIVCAVQGRPRSRETATQAIDMALEHNARLTFVLVMDAKFLEMATPVMTPVRALYKQLEEMGEFAMLILVDRAQRRGVAEVAYFVLKGEVKDELNKLAKTTDADVLVLGRPDPKIRKSIFQPAEFNDFVADIREHTGLEVVIVDPRP